MLIRSQNKKTLTHFSFVTITTRTVRTSKGERKNAGYNVVAFSDGHKIVVGKYSTELKALRVMNEIQGTYLKYCFKPGGLNFASVEFIPPKVFQMPADDEVEA